MKIAIIANSSLGLFNFRQELIGRLCEENEVVAITPDNGKISEIKAIGCRIIGSKIDRRGLNPIKDFALFLSYIVALHREKADLVITYTIKPNIYGALAARILKIPYAVNITGLGSMFQHSGILKTIVVLLYRIALKKAKVVYFENVENKNVFINERIISEDKTCLLAGAGVNLERYTVVDYPTDKTTLFLFVGRVMREKGIDELFAAMKRLVADGEDVHLDILGGYEESYQSIIEEYEREGWLTYHGYQTDVKPFISRSHCFVLPSWHEGMANTNLENAASGRPVITTNIHGCLEAVEDGITGFLVEKNNSDDLYEVMKKFLTLSFDERKAMGIAGRNRMERYFDKHIVVENTISRL